MGVKSVAIEPVSGPRTLRFQSAADGFGPKAVRTRRRILAAAAREWADRGADGLSVQAVADRAGVGRTSFYNYFPTLDDVRAAVVDAFVSDFARSVAESHGALGDGARRLALALRLFVERAALDPEWGRLLCRLADEEPRARRILDRSTRRSVEESIRTGRFALAREDVDSYLLLLRGSALAAIREVIAGGCDAATLGRLVSHCLCAAGLEREQAVRIAGELGPGSPSDGGGARTVPAQRRPG